MMKRVWLAGLFGGVLSVLLLAGCMTNTDSTMTNSGTGISSPARNLDEKNPNNGTDTVVPVKIYFGAHDAEHIVAEVHMIRQDALLMLIAMETLIDGPQNRDLVAVVPSEARVKSVNVRERIAYVDFSDEIVTHGFGGSSREILAVGAIVNTLTEFPEVERVQILVEGKKVNTLFGHMDISEPLSRSPGIIQ